MKEEVTGEWRNLNIEQLSDLYCSLIFFSGYIYKIGKNEVDMECDKYGDREELHTLFCCLNLKERTTWKT